MNKYVVTWRESVRHEAFGHHIRLLDAHKVEGWTNDYAFYGHPHHTDMVTVLIPREMVVQVELIKGAYDDQDIYELKAADSEVAKESLGLAIQSLIDIGRGVQDPARAANLVLERMGLPSHSR